MAIRDGSANGEAAQDYSALFDSPDFTALVRPAQTAKAKEYSGMVKSMLKAGVVGAINIGDFPDAAAFLHYGPAFADASGQLADADARAAKAIEILTAPGNPYVMFVVTALPLLSQLFRNHEDVLTDLPNTVKNARKRKLAMATAKKAEKPRFTIRVLGREFPIRFRGPKIGKVFSVLKAQTRDPGHLTAEVFTDPRVIRALQKQGIVLVRAGENDTNPPA
jgi:hypothetical protein